MKKLHLSSEINRPKNTVSFYGDSPIGFCNNIGNSFSSRTGERKGESDKFVTSKTVCDNPFVCTFAAFSPL